MLSVANPGSEIVGYGRFTFYRSLWFEFITKAGITF